MKFIARFDTDRIWKPEIVSIMDAYLRGEITQDEAITKVGTTKEGFMEVLHQIFVLLLRKYAEFSIAPEGEGQLTLSLDRGKAKTIQVALAVAKNHIKEGSDTMREVEGLERELEAFTGSASVYITG